MENVNLTSGSTKKRGREPKEFDAKSDRSVRRTIDNESLDPKVDSIHKALLMARRTAFKRHDVNVVKVIGHLLKNQDYFSKMYVQLTNDRQLKTPEEAFALIIEAHLTKAQYEIFHFDCPSRYPPYNVIAGAKKTCAPPVEFIEGSASKIKVELQALMNHTASRILQVIRQDVTDYLDSHDLDCAELVLLSSWGMDGSTGYSQFNHSLPEGSIDDSDVFAATLTPIQLYVHSDGKHILWHNPTPQSIRFCRPIMLQFIKESREIILKTKHDLEKEMCELTPLKIDLPGDKFVLIDFNFVLSMIDGKVLTYITGSSSMQNCPICGATPNIMNSIEKLEEGFTANEDTLYYGISPLHAWIRFFECLLHISYRMEIKQWRVTKDLKLNYLKRKKMVLEALHKAFGFRADQPRSGGKGTSTTGNICRKAFSNPELLSSVLGIEKELIERFRNILIAINCQEAINPEIFDEYCKDTYRFYLEHYEWYKIPATLHKVLAHAGDIILHSPAPLGVLAEEAAECQHKHLKLFRSHFARKRSREANLMDVFLRALHESDPYLSSMWVSKKHTKKVCSSYPTVVRSFMVFEDSESDTSSNIMNDLMDAVDEVDEDFEEDVVDED